MLARERVVLVGFGVAGLVVIYLARRRRRRPVGLERFRVAAEGAAAASAVPPRAEEPRVAPATEAPPPVQAGDRVGGINQAPESPPLTLTLDAVLEGTSGLSDAKSPATAPSNAPSSRERGGRGARSTLRTADDRKLLQVAPCART